MSWEPLTHMLGGAFCTGAASARPGAVKLDGVCTIQIGSVELLPQGSLPTVTNSGTSQHAVLHFGLPEMPGVGIVSITAAGQDEQGGNRYRVLLTDGSSYEFVAPAGRVPEIVDEITTGDMRPVTSNAVSVTVGNIEALMGTI